MTKIDRFFIKNKSNGVVSRLEDSKIDQSETDGWKEVKVNVKVNAGHQFVLPHLKTTVFSPESEWL